MTTTTSHRPNTHQMVVGHRVFRREFRLLPELIAGVVPGDRPRARVLAEHGTDVTSALHAHHSSEDELLWPRLLDRASLQADLVHRMQEQHGRIGVHLERIGSLLPVWAQTARRAERDELYELFAGASVVLEQHLDDEEREILPLAAAHLTVAEWEQLGRSMHASMRRDQMLTFLGMVLEDATPEEQKRTLAAMPLPGRLAWMLIGARRYRSTVRRVRGVAGRA